MGKSKPADGSTVFPGFSAGVTRLTSLPEAFFTELLPTITDIAELKVIMYAFWAIQQMEGEVRFLRYQDLCRDSILLNSLPFEKSLPEATLDAALKKAVDHGIFLLIEVQDQKEKFYLFNTARNRAATEGYKNGTWTPTGAPRQNVGLDLESSELFSLYEQNIGMITPMLAEQLKMAEHEYPAEWIKEAMLEAVRNNVRRWSYIHRILESWRERGRNAKDR